MKLFRKIAAGIDDLITKLTPRSAKEWAVFLWMVAVLFIELAQNIRLLDLYNAAVTFAKAIQQLQEIALELMP